MLKLMSTAILSIFLIASTVEASQSHTPRAQRPRPKREARKAKRQVTRTARHEKKAANKQLRKDKRADLKNAKSKEERKQIRADYKKDKAVNKTAFRDVKKNGGTFSAAQTKANGGAAPLTHEQKVELRRQALEKQKSGVGNTTTPGANAGAGTAAGAGAVSGVGKTAGADTNAGSGTPTVPVTTVPLKGLAKLKDKAQNLQEIAESSGATTAFTQLQQQYQKNQEEKKARDDQAAQDAKDRAAKLQEANAARTQALIEQRKALLDQQAQPKNTYVDPNQPSGTGTGQ